jgi:hypothetical protein
MDANWPHRSLGFRVCWKRLRISVATGGLLEADGIHWADVDEDVSVASLLRAS